MGNQLEVYEFLRNVENADFSGLMTDAELDNFENYINQTIDLPNIVLRLYMEEEPEIQDGIPMPFYIWVSYGKATDFEEEWNSERTMSFISVEVFVPERLEGYLEIPEEIKDCPYFSVGG